MAIINQGILGGLRKKVGNVVGASWKGIPVLKIYQPVVSNPKTAAQVQVRTGFKNFAGLASLILASFIKPLWDRNAVRMSGYNAFMNANKAGVAGNLDPYGEDLVPTKGKMDATAIATATASASALTLSWDGSAISRYGLSTDIAYLLVTNETKKEVCFAGQCGASIVRSTEAATIAAASMLNVPATGDTLHFFLSFLRADGTIVSDSSHSEVTVA